MPTDDLEKQAEAARIKFLEKVLAFIKSDNSIGTLEISLSISKASAARIIPSSCN